MVTIYRVLIKYDPFVWIFLPHLNTILTSEEFNPAHPYTTFSLPFFSSDHSKISFLSPVFTFPFLALFSFFPLSHTVTTHSTQNKTKQKQRRNYHVNSPLSRHDNSFFSPFNQLWLEPGLEQQPNDVYIQIHLLQARPPKHASRIHSR